jgi:WD40 repeat protein
VADRGGKCIPPLAIIFCADGRIAYAAVGPRITLWNYKTDQERFLSHDECQFWLRLASVAGGKLLASGGSDGTVRLWDLAADKEINRLQVSSDRDQIMGLACAQDGRTLAVGTGEGLCSIWDLIEGKETLVFDEHRQGVRASISPDGTLAASGSMDDTIRIWDLTSGRPIRTWQAHQIGVRNLSFGAGQQLVSGGGDGSVQIWDAKTGKRIGQVAAPKKQPITALDVSHDGKCILAIDCGIRLIVWHADSGKKLCGFVAVGPRSAVLTPDGRQIVASTDETIVVYDVQIGKRLVTASYGPATVSLGEDSAIWLAMSPDGASFASAGHDKTVRIWDLPSCKERRQMLGHSETPSCIAFSADGRLIATADVRGGVLLWEVASGQIVYRFVAHPTAVQSVAFTPDCRALLTAGSDTTALLWSLDPSVGDSNSSPAHTLGNEQFAQLWRDLAAEDGATPYRAGWRLSSHSDQAVAFLRTCLKPILAPEPKPISELILALDDNRFAAREKASRGLEAFGDTILTMLRQAQKSTESLEARNRLEHLIALAESRTSPGMLRDRRAIGVLERIGTPEARDLLESVARGVPDAAVTRDARASCDRLAHAAWRATKEP